MAGQINGNLCESCVDNYIVNSEAERDRQGTLRSVALWLSATQLPKQQAGEAAQRQKTACESGVLPAHALKGFDNDAMNWKIRSDDVMNDFYTARRERFLNEEPYGIFVKGRQAKIKENLSLIETELPSHESDSTAYMSWGWGVASGKFQLLVGCYSAGDPIQSVVQDFPVVMAAIEASALPHPTYRTESFYLDEPDTYAYAMWLLSLAKLLRLDYLVPRVAALFDVARDDNRGQDALFEALLEKLGLPREPVDKCLKNMKAHPLLLEAIQAEPTKRPKLIAQFLDKWYPSMKACYWHGVHHKVPQAFFGYWAFEAGLVTYLWDIDDSSYRDMPFYPKDLVAYARSHEAADPQAASAAGAKQRLNVHAGEPCPEAGFWFTPAQSGSRRYFKVGDVMPEFKSDYGATIWQWDPNQLPPTL